MTPKEKADSLVDTYRQFMPYYSKTNNFKRAVGSALIAVDKILNSDPNNLHIEYDYNKNKLGVDVEYWIEVRQEIEKLWINK